MSFEIRHRPPADQRQPPAQATGDPVQQRGETGWNGNAVRSVGKLDHYNVSTRKLKETVQFYETVLGLNNGARPPFNFPGAWLYSEGHPVLHINDISATDRPQPVDSGVIDHIAFGSRGFKSMQDHLSRKGVPFRSNQVPNSQRWQIFLHDPNNVMIELNFPG